MKLYEGKHLTIEVTKTTKREKIKGLIGLLIIGLVIFLVYH